MNKILKNLPKNALKTLSVVVTDTDNKITFISENYLRQMGYTSKEVLGQNPSFFRHPSVENVTHWESLHIDHHWNGLLKNITKDSKAIYYNADIYKDFDDDGNHIGFHSFHTDITNSITDPHLFIFDNELLELFFTNSDEYIIICLCKSDTNPKQRIIEISEKVTKLIGLEKTDVIKNELSITDIINKNSKYHGDIESLIDDYENDKDIIIQLYNRNITLSNQFKITMTSFLFQDELARIFKLTDITKEIEYANKLNEIIKSKNNFLAHISHEIKTPLNAVNGFLTLLQLKEKDKDKSNYIDIMLDSSKHILDLSNDVIDFAQIDNKKLEITPREFTGKDIQSTIEIFFAKSLEKNIEFETFISPQLPEVMSQDILRLKQVYTNLISNALKFVDDGGSINIDVHYFEGDLYFSIVDNGIGMSPAQIKKIFKPFSQATEDTQLFYGGTGLGLAVVKEIVELMGGRIEIESVEGEGSSFCVMVPVKSVKKHIIIGKILLDTIYIYAPTFSKNKFDTIRKYLIHFSSAKIEKTESIENLNNQCIFINLEDITDISLVQKASVNNKIILIKNMNTMIHTFTDNKNIVEINLPVIGSKIYDALNILLHGFSSSKDKDITFDLHIKGNILVAEDLDSNRLLIKELLSEYDININFAHNGKEALTAFKNSIKKGKSSYDLILLDMNMPIMDGSKAAYSIRNFESQLNIIRTPLVALTANRYNTKDDKRLLNMDEYLPKPINLKQMLSIIIKYTSNLNVEDNKMFDKSKQLKKIRDSFLKNDKNIGHLISKLKNHFSSDEYEVLLEIKNISNDKHQFRKFYNKLLKMIRKDF